MVLKTLKKSCWWIFNIKAIRQTRVRMKDNAARCCSPRRGRWERNSWSKPQSQETISSPLLKEALKKAMHRKITNRSNWYQTTWTYIWTLTRQCPEALRKQKTLEIHTTEVTSTFSKTHRVKGWPSIKRSWVLDTRIVRRSAGIRIAKEASQLLGSDRS